MKASGYQGGMHEDRRAGNDSAEPYAVTAEFYDILQAETDQRLAEHRFAAAADAARVGIVDVGAGTGIVTEVLLSRSTVPIHAVEPSAPMRVALLSRLAAMTADKRARVTVHPDPLQDAGLHRMADLVVCSNVAGVLDPAQRRALWRAIATVLVPGGSLLLEPPPETVPDSPISRDLPPVRVGPDVYSARVCTRPDRGLLSVTFTYKVERDAKALRTETEEFTMWPASHSAICAEVRESGLEPVVVAATGLIQAFSETR
jgi:SAM-dependent methyltransferase